MRIKIQVKFKELCPYCNKKEIKKATCGDWQCQFKHKILQMRKKRKTDQVRTTRYSIEL